MGATLNSVKCWNCQGYRCHFRWDLWQPVKCQTCDGRGVLPEINVEPDASLIEGVKDGRD